MLAVGNGLQHQFPRQRGTTDGFHNRVNVRVGDGGKGVRGQRHVATDDGSRAGHVAYSNQGDIHSPTRARLDERLVAF